MRTSLTLTRATFLGPLSPSSHRFVLPTVSRRVAAVHNPDHHRAGFILTLAAALAWVPQAHAQTPAEPRALPGTLNAALYPGIPPAQDSLALALIREIHSFRFDKSEDLGRALEDLERKNRLPPLSQLLALSERVLRLENSDFNDDREQRRLAREADRLADQGLSLCKERQAAAPDSIAVTYDFVRGGILGYHATLGVYNNPLEALSNGLEALKTLERVLAENDSLTDAYLGLGIFNCAMARAPKVLQSTLQVFNRGVSLDSGLLYLRRCASSGRYTGAVAKLYLAHFLSPYDGSQAAEKSAVFRSLHDAYPGNAYYTFIDLDESICFQPDAFYSPAVLMRVESRFSRFEKSTPSLRKYAELVSLQRQLIMPAATAKGRPKASSDLGCFSYYPGLVWAVALMRLAVWMPRSFDKEGASVDQTVRLAGDKAYSLLDKSDMRAGTKRFYAWHAREALKRRERGESE